jgi:hypothetical protein
MTELQNKFFGFRKLHNAPSILIKLYAYKKWIRNISTMEALYFIKL